MEFDTHIPLLKRFEERVRSSAPFEQVHKGAWEILGKESSNLADAGGGEIWADFSTRLLSRYIVCTLVRDEENGEYIVRLRAGRRPSYVGDILICVLFILGLWSLSKLLVPSPPMFYTILMLVCMCAAGWLMAYLGKAFGVVECGSLGRKIVGMISSLPNDSNTNNVELDKK